MFSKKKETYTLSDLKKANNELYDLQKEIKREIKQKKNRVILDEFAKINFDLAYKSVRFQEMTSDDIRLELLLTSILKSTMIDAQEMLKKGTKYGLQLALHRAQTIIEDRQIGKSPFEVEEYRKFEENLWNITRLREFAYGTIERLKTKQDQITRSALQEVDSMMRVRYFDDIRVLEKDILRLENEAHQYDTLTVALRSEGTLENVVKKYIFNDKTEAEKLDKFEELLLEYTKRGGE